MMFRNPFKRDLAAEGRAVLTELESALLKARSSAAIMRDRAIVAEARLAEYIADHPGEDVPPDVRIPAVTAREFLGGYEDEAREIEGNIVELRAALATPI